MKKNYIWIFSENLSNTLNNNSFYFWKHILNRKDGIDKYFVLSRTKENWRKYKQLTTREQQYVIWRNSLKHIVTYLRADMLFVTLSYRDVIPDNILYKKVNWHAERPVIYLQHGTTAMKQLGYTYNSYNNNLFRFIYYNPNIKEQLLNINGFKPYQLYYGEYHPRYMGFVAENDKWITASPATNNQNILWFLTWREYFGNNFATKRFVYLINKILSNDDLQNYLYNNNTILTVCLHPFIKQEIFNFSGFNGHSNIKIVTSEQVDIMDLLIKNDILITDYSSVGFDFTFLNKPVILFQPDIQEYLRKRRLYCEIDELNMYNLTEEQELIQAIINKKYSINPFFRKRLPEIIDYDYVRTGKHIDRMYEYFWGLQINKITFIGYNFYGIGGTVFATKALAEGLLEKGYMVELLSLKKTNEAKEPPAAVNMRYCYDARPWNKIKKIEKLKRFIRGAWFFNYLKNDPSVDYLIPYAELDLTYKLTHMKSKTVISTRESLHLFLQDASSNHIKNKIFFYHTQADVVDELFPGLIKKLSEKEIMDAAFVTEANRQQLIERFGYDNYRNYCITGNALDSSRCIEISQIQVVTRQNIYKGVFLLRINEERKDDIENLINFGLYLKDNSIKNITIDVYGSGDALEYFFSKIFENDLVDIICYRGTTNSIKNTLKKYDVVTDFSLSQSFGMTYIEGILNGKMVYCMRTIGALEVLNEIPSCYIDSFEELVNKICHLPDITLSELQHNYMLIAKKYSRDAVTQRFLDAFSL